MDGERFDQIARFLATGTARRRVLRGFAAVAGWVGGTAFAGRPGEAAPQAEGCRVPGETARRRSQCCTKRWSRPRRRCRGCRGGRRFCEADRACVDTATDPANCGRCGEGCVGEEVCKGGDCCRPLDVACTFDAGCCTGFCPPAASRRCRCPAGQVADGGECRPAEPGELATGDFCDPANQEQCESGICGCNGSLCICRLAPCAQPGESCASGGNLRCCEKVCRADTLTCA